MPLICYEHKKLSQRKLDMIRHANTYLRGYEGKGLDCTLRQLYYQFVQDNMLPNLDKSYDWFGSLISDGRMAGLIDWNHIVDRTRNVLGLAHWDRPSKIIHSAYDSYMTDSWSNQPHYLEVWVEKDALRGIVNKACSELDVSHFSCRGYTSQSEAWAASQRFQVEMDKGKQCTILHLGDHDPSGIDMTRDIRDRLNNFTQHFGLEKTIDVKRIALNMAQVEEYSLVPNPAKVSDSRFAAYMEQYGDQSYELDALKPELLVQLITEGVEEYRDDKLWAEQTKIEKRGKDTLRYVNQYWPDVVKFLRDRREVDDSPVVCTKCLATQNNPRCLCKEDGPVRRLSAPGEEF